MGKGGVHDLEVRNGVDTTALVDSTVAKEGAITHRILAGAQPEAASPARAVAGESAPRDVQRAAEHADTTAVTTIVIRKTTVDHLHSRVFSGQTAPGAGDPASGCSPRVSRKRAVIYLYGAAVTNSDGTAPICTIAGHGAVRQAQRAAAYQDASAELTGTWHIAACKRDRI